MTAELVRLLVGLAPPWLMWVYVGFAAVEWVVMVVWWLALKRKAKVTA